jgi:F-type H+-transporting ATPase subunit b
MNTTAIFLSADYSGLIDTIFRSNVLNFITVVFILVWLINRFRVFSVISDKQKAINIHIKQSEESKIEAEVKLKEALEKVKNTDVDVAQISKNAQEVAKTLSEKIVEDAHAESENIHSKSIKAAEAEKNTAIGDLTKQTTQAAFIIAGEHIKQAIDHEMHKKYIDEFINNLDKMKVTVK